jgi:hypothetical protein
VGLQHRQQLGGQREGSEEVHRGSVPYGPWSPTRAWPLGRATARQQPRRRHLEHPVGLLASDGYARFTLDERPTRSGVAKTTIWRRWPSKPAVAAARLEQLVLQSVSVPDTGPLRGDLQGMLLLNAFASARWRAGTATASTSSLITTTVRRSPGGRRTVIAIARSRCFLSQLAPRPGVNGF